MQIIEVDLDHKRQVKAFLDLPFMIYRDTPQWVPPLAMDTRRMLDRKRHPFYQHSEGQFLLAMDERGNAIGRLAVLNNRNYNSYNNSHSAFLYLFEAINDKTVSQALFSKASAWARERNLVEIIGPKGFTALDGVGLLVEGFKHRPAFGLPYNPYYYIDLIESAGFQPHGELVSGYLSRQSFQMPTKILEVAELVRKRRGLRVHRFRKRQELRNVIPKLKTMYNSALSGTSGNVPLTDEEVKTIADQLIWFADPSLIKIIFKADEPVGFLFAYPDISAAIQRTGGRVFPFGWVPILRELRQTRWLNINGAGIIEAYRGLGGTALLFSELYKTVSESRFVHIEVVQIGTENDRMQRELRNLGVDFYKKHRVYRRVL